MKAETKEKIKKVIIIFICASVLSTVLYFVKTEQYKNWQSADGVLTDTHQFYGARKHGSGRSYRLYYRYAVDGVTYDGYDQFSGNIPDSHYIGEPVTIWYNPENHSSSFFAKPGPGLWPYAPFIFAVPISLSAIGFRRKRVSVSM